VALNLYLDDCADSTRLYQRLVDAGHSVTRPRDVNLTGADDEVHFNHAANTGLVLVTRNPRDYLDLHGQNRNHAGIFLIYADNDPDRDMGVEQIVAAIGRIEQASESGLRIAGEVQVLNQWRG